MISVGLGQPQYSSHRIKDTMMMLMKWNGR